MIAICVYKYKFIILKIRLELLFIIVIKIYAYCIQRRLVYTNGVYIEKENFDLVRRKKKKIKFL